MKTPVRLIALSLILIVLTSCASVSTFHTPNDLSNKKATLFLKNGYSVSGYLTIHSENKKHNKVSIQTSSYGKPQNFKLKHIKGYSIGEAHFFLKEIDNTTIVLENGNSLLDQLLTKKKYYFMRRLTPADSRIHLYANEYTTEPYGNSNTSNRLLEYFIQLPNDSSNTVYNIEGRKLIPHFELKMSALVSDCPTLASKITQKEPGYFYAPLRFPILSQNKEGSMQSSLKTGLDVLNDKYVAILLSIINEYNHCK